VRTYTEQEVKDAWSAVISVHQDTPSYEFQRRFFQMLDAVKLKEEPVLYGKQDLLDVAATEHEKVMIHGIFAMLGTEKANDNALMHRAREASLGGNMTILLGLARAKKEEDFRPGDVVRDANRAYWKLMPGRKWATFEHAMFVDYHAPLRPLEKMP